MTQLDQSNDAPSTAGKDREFNRRSALVIIGSFLGLSVSAGPLFASTQGIFMLPITEEFGWDRGQITLAGLLGGVLSVLALPVVGAAIDRWGVRRVLPVGILVLAANLAFLSIVPGVLLIYMLVFGLAGFTATPQGPVSYVKTLSRWFDRNRGLAIGIAVSGLAFGQIVVPQYTVWLISQFGWRGAYVGLGILLLVIGLPAVLIFIRDPRPGEVTRVEVTVDVPVGQLPGLTGRQALRTVRFWLLAVSILLVAAAAQGALVHMVPLAMDAGWDPVAAAGLLGVAGAASVIGRLGGGYLYDRFHAPYVGAAVFVAGAAGLGVLAAGGSPVIAAVLIGITAGAETDLMAFLSSRYFGFRSLGQVNGYLFAAFGLGVPIGAAVLGSGYEAAGGSYAPTLIVFTVAVLAASVLLLLMPKSYPYPTERAHDRKSAKA